MYSKRDLLGVLANHVRHSDFGWDRDFSAIRPADPARVEEIRKNISVPYSEERLQGMAGDPILQRQALLQDILEDVRGFVPVEHQTLVDSAILGLLPTGKVNASCFGKKTLSDGYLIAINNGFLDGTSLLSAALIVETSPDETSWEGTQFFAWSQLFFDRAPNSDREEAVSAQSKLLPQTSFLAGANHAVMLWFVALHELGHIINGDVDSGFASCYLNDESGVEFTTLPDWDIEFRADRYALDCFVNDRPNAERAWTNYATVDLMFRWLEILEDSRPPSKTHPPAKMRLQRLRERMLERWGPDPSDHLSYLDSLVSKWMNPDQAKS